MDYAKLLERPRGEMKIKVHLRRGTNADAKGTQDKKTLVGDAVTIVEFLDTAKAVAGARGACVFDSTHEDYDAETAFALLCRTYGEVVKLMQALGSMSHLKIQINGDDVFVHPDDVSHVTVKTTGLFDEIKKVLNA